MQTLPEKRNRRRRLPKIQKQIHRLEKQPRRNQRRRPHRQNRRKRQLRFGLSRVPALQLQRHFDLLHVAVREREEADLFAAAAESVQPAQAASHPRRPEARERFVHVEAERLSFRRRRPQTRRLRLHRHRRLQHLFPEQQQHFRGLLLPLPQPRRHRGRNEGQGPSFDRRRRLFAGRRHRRDLPRRGGALHHRRTALLQNQEQGQVRPRKKTQKNQRQKPRKSPPHQNDQFRRQEKHKGHHPRIHHENLSLSDSRLSGAL